MGRHQLLGACNIFTKITMGCSFMKTMPITKVFTLFEPGPVVWVTTHDGEKINVMTISWMMVIDFSPRFAITTGDWNYSYNALQRARECVIAIPTVDQIDQVVGVGTCSGSDTDKFEKFGLTPIQAKHAMAPLIKECLANIECRVIDIIKHYDIIVLEGIEAYFDDAREEKRTLHAVGNGTFIVDGEKLDRREMMKSKLPENVL
jgi:flavin reductase (DIM6/NTAB) family NADH-FMN oxidoreductase RutF